MAMHFKKQEKTEAERKKSTERRGFYLALAVCLTAIGIAAWSTYDTVSGFLEPTGSESSASSSASTPRPTPEASAPVDDDPESAVSAGHAQGTVPEVSASTEAEPQEVNAPAEETPVEETAAEPTYTVSETLTRPVPGEVMTEFSDTPVYSETMRDYRVHAGTDYTAAHGETVHACANGIVKETHTDMLRGNMIVIEHGDYEVRYCGLGETFLVHEGDVVTAGQKRRASRPGICLRLKLSQTAPGIVLGARSLGVKMHRGCFLLLKNILLFTICSLIFLVSRSII